MFSKLPPSLTEGLKTLVYLPSVDDDQGDNPGNDENGDGDNLEEQISTTAEPANESPWTSDSCESDDTNDSSTDDEDSD